jgi:membrane associated rhomboid family serine protease
MSKSLSLLLTVLILIISIHHVEDWSTVGIYTGCGLGCRMLYPFYHANLLHALLNAWCLLSVIFIYDISLLRFILAYIIAVTIPPFCLSDTPTVGMSGLVFALFGSISFEVQRKAYYQLYMLAYLVAGFLFPNTNALLHLYCYMAGGVVALLNKPVKIG